MTGDDLERLDDPERLAAGDPSQMLRAVASSAAQVRASLSAVREADLSPLDLDSRPRAVVVTGMGGSGIAGDVLAAVAGPGCPVPVVVHRGYGLPGWVGAADLVVAVSCSGATQETLSAVVEAVRRGARLVGVGGAGSSLAEHCQQASAGFVPVTKELSPRSSIWALATPVLVIGARLGLLGLGPDEADLEAAAGCLESVAARCRPDLESFVNPGKQLAGELAGSLPMVWGAGQTAPAAVARTVCQLAENAKLPAVGGVLPEAHHNLVVAFDGVLAGAAADEDLFRDRVEDDDPVRLRLVLLRDDEAGQDGSGSESAAGRRADISIELARQRGLPVSEIRAEGTAPVERLASLVGLIDYASVYLAVLLGVDPTPIGPIDALKQRLA